MPLSRQRETAAEAVPPAAHGRVFVAREESPQDRFLTLAGTPSAARTQVDPRRGHRPRQIKCVQAFSPAPPTGRSKIGVSSSSG